MIKYNIYAHFCNEGLDMKKLLALIMAMLMLTGCSGIADKDNIINLLSSPKLSQRESEIVRCITKHLGEDVILKYPKQGSNISPVQVVDLSADGRQEAVVLYSAPNKGGNVRIAVLSATETGWQLIYDAEGYGSEVYKIVFSPLDRSGNSQIIAGYTFSDSSEKLFSVYSPAEGAIREVQTQSCQDFMVQDVTGDSISDIVYAGINADNQRTQVRILSCHGSPVLTSVALRRISVPNARVTNIAFSKNDFSDKNAILIDYTDVYYRVYTQRMYFEDYNLHTILSPDVVQKRWVYDYNLISKDIDSDGYLETPTVIDTGSQMPENLKFMEWTGFLTSEPERKYYGFCEAETGLFFPLPDSWQNLLSLRYGTGADTWQVYRVSDDYQIMECSLLSAGYSNKDDPDRIVVNVGTQQIKITFAADVTRDQRTYITAGIMNIKQEK